MVEQLYMNLRRRHKLLKESINKIENRMQSYPEGTLNYQMCNGVPQYFVNYGSTMDEDGKRARKRLYIPSKNRKQAAVLAQKDYEKNAMNLMIKECRFIENMIEAMSSGLVENYFDNLPDARRKLVNPILKSQHFLEAEWKAQSYTPLSTDELVTNFYTERGERVRSKSEILIANQLYKRGIAYKYECPLELSSTKVIYPDFSCFSRKSNRVMYWEHLGMMDNIGYCERNIDKISVFENHGLFPGTDLILTFETSSKPINTRMIDKIISKYLC